MAPETITKSDISILVEVHTKAVQQQERMANALQSIAEEQKEIRDILAQNQKTRLEYLHVMKDHQSEICMCTQTAIINELVDVKNKFLEPMKTIVFRASIILSSITFIIAIVEIIFRVFLK